MPGNFRQLDVYRLATELADEVHRSVRRWPALDRSTMGPQVLRAADSVGPNIPEAPGRWPTPDTPPRLITARGSPNELEPCLPTAERRGLMEEGSSLRVDRIAQALNGMVR